jgi:hypothetical protein
MHITVTLAATLALAFSSTLGPSLSSVLFKPESRYTELNEATCLPGHPQERGGASSDWARCPGLGGARILLGTDEDGVALGLEWSARERSEDLVRGASIGPMLEWRGVRTPSLTFDPHALIVALSLPESGKGTGREVLAVLRVGKTEACLAGLVDRATGGNAEAIARRFADEQASGADCPKERPLAQGLATDRPFDLAPRS